MVQEKSRRRKRKFQVNKYPTIKKKSKMEVSSTSAYKINIG